MNKIWWFTPCLSDEPGLDRLGRHCRLTIGAEVITARLGAHESASSNLSTARLELALESFSLDCFYWVDCKSLHPYLFVSEDLRDAMALDARDVQYLPVDASLSAPLPRSKNYMIMHTPVVENVSDPDQSVYHGTAGSLEKPMLVERIAIGRGADPEHDIFRDGFFSGFVFCTDELAVRVLQRQCTGLRFVDPWDITYPIFFRSLRGVEEESRDTVREESHIVQGVSEAYRVLDGRLPADDGGIYADYDDHIPGVQFAAVPIPLGSLAVEGTNRENLAGLPDESLGCDGDDIVTAAQLLDAVDRSKDRDFVRSALTRFQLNPELEAHVLAARAYVWANKFVPLNFVDVPASGPGLESVSESIMQVELARPGTLYLALQGDLRSIAYIKMAAEEGLNDVAGFGIGMRAAHIPAALRSTRMSARAALDL